MASPWPAGYEPGRGFSDRQLEAICHPRQAKVDKQRLASPALFWSSEMYSHGAILRAMIGWPAQLPLPFFSDHGIHLARNLEGPERDNPARIHLAWSAWRPKGWQGDIRKKVLHFPHPWVWWRAQGDFRRAYERSGSLLFVPHGLPGRPRSIDWGDYMSRVLEVAGPAKPTAIMLAMHDVNAGLHRTLRQFGLPILTAGSSASPKMVERFHDIVDRYSMAVSTEVGSHSFLAENAGARFFLLGHLARAFDYREPSQQTGSELLALTEAAFSLSLSHPDRQRFIDPLMDQAVNRHLVHSERLPLSRADLVREIFHLTPHLTKSATVFLMRNLTT